MKLKSTSRKSRDGAVKRSISLPQSMADKAEEMAQQDGRTLSNYIQRLVQQDVDSRATDGAPQTARP